MLVPKWLVNVTLIGVLGLFTALVLRRGKLPSALCWASFGLSAVVSLGLCFGEEAYLIDARTFWAAGERLWRGESAYARPEVLNPPTALPLYALVATMPLPTFLGVWKALSLLGLGALVPAAYLALRSEPSTRPARVTLTAPHLALLSALVLLSSSARHALIIGQISFLTTLALLVALWARQRHKSFAAGVALAVSSIKIPTTLPFFLLFLRKRDLRTWLWLALTTLVLTLLAIHPAALIDELTRNLLNITQASQPGSVNDYSAAGHQTDDLIALNYALYQLGLHDRTLISVGQLALTLLLGGWVLWHVRRLSATSFAAAAALVAAFSAIFLYHRLYDMLILVVPLVYCTERAMNVTGRALWHARACILLVLAVLFLRLNLISAVHAAAPRLGIAGTVLNAVVTPAAVWLVIALILLLPLGENLDASGAGIASEQHPRDEDERITPRTLHG